MAFRVRSWVHLTDPLAVMRPRGEPGEAGPSDVNEADSALRPVTSTAGLWPCLHSHSLMRNRSWRGKQGLFT